MHPENTDIYSWSYLITGIAGRSFRKIVRFSYLKLNVSSNDWVGNFVWGSPIVPLAPPRQHDHGLALNIDTYINYVDK